MSNPIKVKATLCNLTKGGQACYQLTIKDANPMPREAFVKDFAAAIGVPVAKAEYINDMHGQVFCKGIVQNKIVNTGTLRGYLVVDGSIDAIGAPLDKLRNPVRVVINPHGELKDAASELIAVNDTLVIEAVLRTIQYGTSDMLNTIEGTGVIKANGTGLKITAANPDEGIWLEDLTTGVAVTDKATISANDENTIDFSFAELPDTSETDRFRLVIATRNGQSKDDYGVVRLERIVTIVTANAA